MAISAGSVYSELILDGSKYFSTLEKAEKQAENFQKKLEKTGKNLEKVGKNLSKYVTAPIVAMGTLSTKAAIDFESAFAGVRKTVDASEKEFAALEKGIRDMSKEIPASATAIAGVAEAAGQLGIETENILKFTRVMIDLGEATNLSAEEAATTLARFANITQMSQKDFDRLGSTIVELGNNLATTEAEIAAMALRLAGAGSQVGLTEAQIMSFAAALSSVGIEAEAGGSAFSRVMVDMQLAVETNSERLKKFAEVAGMSADEFRRAFQEDAAGAIIAFIKGLGTAEERGLSAIKVLDDMGISEIRLRDALLRAAGASSVFTDALKMGTKAWDENTALTKEAEQRYQTTASQLQIAKNHLQDAAITIGEIVVPYLVTLSEKIKDVATWFKNLNPETQETIVKMAALAAAGGPVLSFSGKLIKGISTAVGWMGKLSGATEASTTVVASLGNAATIGTGQVAGLGLSAKASAILLNPWTAAITAGGVAAYGLYKYLNEDTIPVVDLFADKVENTASRLEQSSLRSEEATRTMVTTISEGTKEAVGAYLQLDEEAKKHLDSLYINSTAITEDIKAELESKYSEMADNILQAVSERRKEDLDNLSEFFNESKTITDKEQQDIYYSTMKYYEDLQYDTQRHQDRIIEILENAAKEKRKLTEEEMNEIGKIQSKMKENAVRILSEQEVESNIILERMKEYDKRITAEQASQHIKEVNRARDEAVKAANEEYEERLALIIRLRDEAGAISKEQADKLIQEAQRQKNETIKSAEDTRLEAINKMRNLCDNLDNMVDTTTGDVLTKWDKIKRWWNGWKPETKVATVTTVVREAAKGGAAGYRTYARGTNFHPGGLALVGEQGPELIELPRGSKVYTANETANMVGLNEDRLANAIVKALKNAGLSKPAVMELNGRAVGKGIVSIIDAELHSHNAEDAIGRGQLAW